LILEDLPEESQATQDVIESVFRGATVEITANVEDARQRILESIHACEDFDVVIADVKVPRRTGEQPDANTVWVEVLDLLDRKKTQTITTSAYLGENKVREVTGDIEQAAAPVPKGPGSTEKIVSRIAGHLIRRGMEEVLGGRGTSQFERGLDPPGSSLTIPLARLTANISAFWRYLPAGDRRRVLQYFDVVPHEDRPDELESVSLGGKN